MQNSNVIDDTYEKIKTMQVRGAMDIAMAAAGALEEFVKKARGNTTEITAHLASAGEKLKKARPTAISLPNSVDYVLSEAEANRHMGAAKFKKTMASKIEDFITKQEKAIAHIAEIGAEIIEDGDTILTHCNSDTVMEILKKAHFDGKKISVVCTESRPRNQGHISARELSTHGLPVTLIVDSAVHLMMKELKVDKVFVGADTIYANGDVVNKIGTSQVAICAHAMEIPFFVAAQSIKFSSESLFGKYVEIEERDPAEVTTISKVKIRNPAFDVTPAYNITAIITERGAIPPESAYQFLYRAGQI
ncbi:MAG: hypothetical protein MSIBF_00640 [Candidatus Altiarchaeales archaeon IMC4]|nr:MAG: hypothetical protein MSIBF_00640 [Candidatus Altiarchaeales archaeon IMC4]